MPISRTLTILAIAATGPLACAMDDVNISDLRFSGGVLSSTYRGAATTSVTGGGGTVTTTSASSGSSRDADSNYRAQLQYMWGKLGHAGGFIMGANLAANQARFENPGSTTTITTPVLDVLVGYAIAPLPEWHLELTPFAGYGWSNTNVSNNNQTNVRSHEKYVEYGLRAATYWTFHSRWQVGLEVPYLIGRSKPTYDATDTSTGNRITVSDNRKNEGFGVLLGVGYRF